MDKSLNSNPRLPWWLTLIQLSPLILQLLGEIMLRINGIPLVVESANPLQVLPVENPGGSFIDPHQPLEVDIPAPLDSL
jgi:hypothetical protein